MPHTTDMVWSRMLLEREVELGVLSAAVERVAESAGLVLVEGAAGVGKTRLLAEAGALAQAAGVRVLSARGTALEREFGFGVVRQLLEPVLTRADVETRGRLLEGPAEAVTEMLGLAAAGERGDGLPVAPVGDFARLNGLFWLLVNVCREGPVVALVDDAQWADAASLRWLAFVLPRLAGLGVLVVLAVRPEEPGAEQRLLNLLFTDPLAVVLRLRPLSRRSAGALVENALGAADGEFVEACWVATGGNPFLLRELAGVLAAEGVVPSGENAERVAQVGARAVARWVGRRLESLPPDYRVFAEAAAVLGDDASIAEITELAGLDAMAGLAAAAGLERVESLAVTRGPGGQQQVRFAHPLVRAAVYQRMDRAQRAARHAAAARMLASGGAAAERIAGHLLVTVPRGDPQVVRWLREAAERAAAHGSPETAVTYLRRCLAEPSAAGRESLEILRTAGLLARQVDMELSAQLLAQALAQAADPLEQAGISRHLGVALLYCGQMHAAGEAFAQAANALAAHQTDLRYRALAWLVLMHGAGLTGGQAAGIDLPGLQQLEPGDSLGGRMLDCALAYAAFLRGDPGAVVRARRSLSQDLLGAEEWLTSSGACFPLIRGDVKETADLLEGAVTRARRSGDLVSLALAASMRGLDWLHRGQLAEAETVLAEATRLVEETSFDVLRPVAYPALAAVLMEQGRLDEAASTLQRTGLSGQPALTRISCYHAEMEARLQRLASQHERALASALTYGGYLRESGFDSPAAFTWRTEAALCLHALGQDREARRYASEQVPLARGWSTPGVTGHALHIAGVVTGGDEGLELLREAVATLEDSPARLEYAKALTSLGAALRASGQPAQARAPLRQALDLAARHGADPLARQARAELVAVGGRPRRSALTGPEALTPSELVIAKLAASGATNREIAQHLSITPKTVEVHLNRIYRKLAIATRSQLPSALRPLSEHVPQAGQRKSMCVGGEVGQEGPGAVHDGCPWPAPAGALVMGQVADGPGDGGAVGRTTVDQGGQREPGCCGPGKAPGVRGPSSVAVLLGEQPLGSVLADRMGPVKGCGRLTDGVTGRCVPLRPPPGGAVLVSQPLPGGRHVDPVVLACGQTDDHVRGDVKGWVVIG
jgi:DNA-binding CsgD family transcriptional regulator